MDTVVKGLKVTFVAKIYQQFLCADLTSGNKISIFKLPLPLIELGHCDSEIF